MRLFMHFFDILEMLPEWGLYVIGKYGYLFLATFGIAKCINSLVLKVNMFYKFW